MNSPGDSSVTKTRRIAFFMALVAICAAWNALEHIRETRRLEARVAELQVELAASADIGRQDEELQSLKIQLRRQIDVIKGLKTGQIDGSSGWLRVLSVLPPEATPGRVRFRSSDGGVECEAPFSFEPAFKTEAASLRQRAEIRQADVARAGKAHVVLTIVPQPAPVAVFEDEP